MYTLRVCLDWWYVMEWNEVGINEVPLFGFVNNGWNRMEHDGTHFIPFHQILYFLFHPIWGLYDGMRDFK